MYAEKLKTNYLNTPIGIDADEITLTWVPVDGQKQTAFHVTICDGIREVYDSGVIASSEARHIPPVKLKGKQSYTWEVILWDENDIPGSARHSHFETGIGQETWQAQWIDPEPEPPQACIKAMDGLPLNKASYLKKTFFAGDYTKARLYVTAHGVYDVYLNGNHVDGYFMAPGTSDYDHRIQVQTYDVGSYLHSGENEIIVTIGEGWWRGSHGWSMFRYCYGTDLALLCQLELDGKPVLCSDTSWVASQDGPLQENDTMQLERYDARKEVENWHGVKLADHGFSKLIGTNMPIATHERLSSKLITTPNGQRVLDFGQNIAGYVEISVHARGNEKIRLQHGDALGKDGNFQINNFQNPDSPLCTQIIEYTCKPGLNQYHQTKCYYGFRYALLETDLQVTGEEFTAVAVYSDMKQTGFFRCGNPDVNQLFQNTLWSMRSNFVDIPTDCPHREKLGFTGDAQVFANTALYLMDCLPVYFRWLKEVASSQFSNGCIRNVVPRNAQKHTDTPVGQDGSAGWCNAFEIVTNQIMSRYNSPQFAAQLYPNLKKWAAYNLQKAKEYRPENSDIPLIYRDYILDCAKNWGEWNEPGRGPRDYFAESAATGHAEVATGYLAYCCLLVSRIARALNYTEDAAYFQDAYEKVKAAYRYLFTQEGVIQSDRQCHYARPIMLELLNETEKQAAADTLSEMIRLSGNHVGTGFLTTCELCNILTDHGHADTAFDLLLQTQQPSWLFPVKVGATTIWESWYGNQNGNPGGSQNHYSLGAICGWLMSRVGGIRLEGGVLTIKPYTDRRLGFAEAEYHSPVGTIVSGWKYEDEHIAFQVEVPANITAALFLPDGTSHVLNPGKHMFKIPA